VLDPADERATATHQGGITLQELERFLDQGERGVKSKAKAPADVALARGAELVGRGRLQDAAAAYRAALQLAGPGSPSRVPAIDALTSALRAGRQWRACATVVAREAPGMPREPAFASVVQTGLGCANSGGTAPWALAARQTLAPLAVEAAALPTAMRDDRFGIYQQLMKAGELRSDPNAIAHWGQRWLDEIDATTPSNDDE
jgi:hypothetical protein